MARGRAALQTAQAEGLGEVVQHAEEGAGDGQLHRVHGGDLDLCHGWQGLGGDEPVRGVVRRRLVVGREQCRAQVVLGVHNVPKIDVQIKYKVIKQDFKAVFRDTDTVLF